MKDVLVACDGCGTVYRRADVPTKQCANCGETTDDAKQVPRLGWIHKFWSRVDL